MARSMARRACRTLLLVGERVRVAVVRGRAQAVVGEVAELLLDRRAAARRSARRQPSGSLLECVGEQVGRVADVEAGGAEVHRAARVRRHDERVGAPPARPDRVDLAVADRRSTSSGSSAAYAPPAPQHRPSSSVSTQPVRGREHGADRAVRLLHVAEVARVLHDDASRPVSRSASGGCVGEPLREVAHPRRERARLGRAEQAAVVLHRRAAARAVDDDRRVAGHRRDHAPRESARLRRHGPRARAARRSSRRRGPASTGARAGARMTVSAARCTSRCHASMTHPVNRYASASRRRRASGVRSDGSESCGSPNRRGTRRRRCASQQQPREREQQPVARQHARRTPSHSATRRSGPASARSLRARAPRACLP